MNPFSWLRQSIAQSVAAGFRDGLALAERELSALPAAEPFNALGLDLESDTEQTQVEQLPEIDPGTAAPLAAFVQQLGISGVRTGPGLPGAPSSEIRRKPGRPRKHNHEPT